MEKMHILLVENCENNINFFIDAFGESGLQFFCSIAREIGQARAILKNALPQVIFININVVSPENLDFFKKMRLITGIFVIFNSGVPLVNIQLGVKEVNYIQLPNSPQTMARVLKNLFNSSEAVNSTITV